MNIKPKNIPIFQQGGVPQWYIDRYGGRTALINWNLNRRYDRSGRSLNTNDHRNAGNLDTVYRKNMAYIGTPDVIRNDIQNFYNSDGGNMTAEEYEKFYNENAAKIRSHWAKDLKYNARTAGKHNQLYKRMFGSRSDVYSEGAEDYNIGYLDDIEDIEGSSTWLRRMDQYETEFDPNNADPNRMHTITLKDGTKATYYKKANGDIGLLKTERINPQSGENPTLPGENPALSSGNIPVPAGLIPAIHTDSKKIDWNNLFGKLKLNLPGLLEAGRLAGSLISNDRMFNAKLKAIRPNLQQTYLTHRQVVGDEGTKQAYYRRAATGETRAALPFTSDADRQTAYRMEAKRVGDELRAQGDLADNAEIRRTSDESNQHLWANTQRRTETANYNTTALNAANADKQNLIANKYAADYTSWDNFLKGIEYRARENQERTKAVQEQIWALDQLNRLENDEEYTRLYENYYNAMKKVEDKYKDPTTGIINRTAMKNDPDVKKAYTALQLKLYELKRQLLVDMLNYLLNNSLFGKNGIKITYKNKNDLLYKTSRDAVEHFRKMVKLTDDSTVRSRMKPIKLSPHPGGRTRRMQLGGVAPFTVFTPVVLGGERSSTSTASTGQAGSSSKSAKSDEDTPLDIIKSLFKELQGLPSDVNSLYASMANFLSELSMLGGQLSTDDLSAMYLQQLLQINRVKFSKDAYDKAKEKATQNDALQEFAVDTSGRLVVQNKDTAELSFATWDEVKKAKGVLNPLTNDQLLNLRAYNQDLKFNDNILNIVNNGIGMSKIADFIKNHKPTLGSTEQTIPGFTKHETNLIKQGFELLLEAPAGDYSFEKYTKEQRKQAEYALKYIYSILPNNMKSVLNVHADMLGTSVENMLTSLINSELSTVTKIEFDAMTGKGAKNADGSSKDGDKIKSNPIMQMIQEQGGVPRRYEIITRDSNTRMAVNGTYYSQIPKIVDDTSIDDMLGKSGIIGILDSKVGITFGDQHVDSSELKDIMYSNTGGAIVTLPCKIVNGHKEVNLGIRETYEKAVQKVQSLGIQEGTPEYLSALGKALKEERLTSLLDSNGYPDKTKFCQFLVVEGYATSKIKNIDTQSLYIEKVSNPDSNLEQRLIRALSTNDKKNNYELDIDYWIWGDDVYRGSVFIPLTNNINAAINAWGNNPVDIDDARSLETRFLTFNKASAAKPSNSEILNETE